MKKTLASAFLLTAGFILSAGQDNTKCTGTPLGSAPPIQQTTPCVTQAVPGKTVTVVVVPQADTKAAIVVAKPADIPKAAPAPVAVASAVTPVQMATVEEVWDFFELGIWFGVPTSTLTSNICGIKVGAPFCSGSGKVHGVETAVFCGATDNVSGVQACILTAVSQNVKGMQFSIVNYGTDVNGLQLGVVNIAKKRGLQIGICNYVEDGAIPFMPFVNWKF